MKFHELENMQLNGFSCYLRKPNKKGLNIYYLLKQDKIGRFYKDIKATFENIEFQCLHELTDSKLK
jgi:hypothetical protein